MKEKNMTFFYKCVRKGLFALMDKDELCPHHQMLLIWERTLISAMLYYKRKQCNENVLLSYDCCCRFCHFQIKNTVMVYPTFLLCQYVRNLVIIEKIKKGRKIVRDGDVDKDYPAVAVTCSNNDGTDVFFGISEPQSGNRQLIHNINLFSSKKLRDDDEIPLKNETIKNALADVLSKNIPSNSNGGCAEVYAADVTLTRKGGQMEDLEFSVALRPRTLQIVDYCAKCQAMFPYCKSHQIK